MMDLNRIQSVLDEQGRTQVWLSNKLGVTQAAVSALMNNRSQPSLKRLFEIAKILGVPAYTLIGDYVKPIEGLLEEEE